MIALQRRPSRGQVRSFAIETGVYVIYSADVLGSDREIDGMGPFRVAPDHGPYARPMPGDWVLTEGDEQYDYEYLGDESGDPSYYPAGAFDSQGLETVDTIDPDDPRADSTDYGEGRHRKWVAELSLADWRACADMLCIDLDARGVPEEYDDTCGSITEYGHIPAVCVRNDEGWSPTNVIDSSLYVSFFSYGRALAREV